LTKKKNPPRNLQKGEVKIWPKKKTELKRTRKPSGTRDKEKGPPPRKGTLWGRE